MSENAIKHFSVSYPEARRLFLEAAAVTKASVKSYKHPTCRGAAGEKLFIDVATVGNPKSRHALVLMSGTHGIEGYCGSAIQTGFLHSNVMQQAPHIKVILVHALNPFGFSHLRRPNENNIDLNRNFIDFHEIPSSESYNRFATVLHQKPTLLTRAKLIAHIFFLGFRTIQEAVTRGQYQHPDGLFFGGREESWARQTWSTILQCTSARRGGSLLHRLPHGARKIWDRANPMYRQSGEYGGPDCSTYGVWNLWRGGKIRSRCKSRHCSSYQGFSFGNCRDSAKWRHSQFYDREQEGWILLRSISRVRHARSICCSGSVDDGERDLPTAAESIGYSSVKNKTAKSVLSK